MSQVTLKGNPCQTIGPLPETGQPAPGFKLTATDLSAKSLSDYAGKKVVLNIFPSLDTETCAMSVRAFNQQASNFDNTVVLCVSADLPFAQGRFCTTEGLDNVIPLSTFRSPDFGQSFGTTLTDGPLAGLESRAIVAIDEQGQVAYTQQVAEIVDEPDYQPVLDWLAQ